MSTPRSVRAVAAIAVVAAFSALALSALPAAAQQDEGGFQRLLDRFFQLEKRGETAKARWRANPTRRTENAARRQRDRIRAFRRANRTELQMAFDMAAHANPDFGVKKRNTDAFGYTAANDVPFQFVNINNDPGRRILQFGDDISVSVELEEPFSFYGTTVQTMVMDTNGYLHTWFGGFTTSDFTNDCPLPTNSTGTTLGNNDAAIFALWDDLDFGNTALTDGGLDESGMYVRHFEACPRPNDINGTDEGCTVFMWDNARHFNADNGDPDWDQQVIIYHTTNQFLIQVDGGNPETGAGSTTGSQDFSAISHLQWDCNEAGSIPDGTAIAFFPPGKAPAVAGLSKAVTLAEPEQRSILPGKRPSSLLHR